MSFFLSLIVFVLFFICITLILEIISLKRNIQNLQKETNSVLPQNLKRINNSTDASDRIINSFQTKNIPIKQTNNSSQINLPSFKNDPILEIKNDRLSFPSVTEIVKSEEMDQKDVFFLKDWLIKSLNGFYFINDSVLPYYKFNLILIDIESNDNQLIFGFYFSSLNTYVQLVIDSSYKENIHFKYQKSLIEFFNLFGILSNRIELDLKSNQMDFNNPVIIPLLVGYNINNFDLPVLDVYLQANPESENPVFITREFVKRLLSGSDKKDWSKFSFLLSNFFVVDIFWETGKRLKDWINILNDSNLFPKLKPKNWNNTKFKRVAGTKLIEWLHYNANDLLATYYLCFYQKNLINYLFPRFQLFFEDSQGTSLISLLKTRFFK